MEWLALVVDVKIIQRPEKVSFLVLVPEDLQQRGCQRSTVITACRYCWQCQHRLEVFGQQQLSANTTTRLKHDSITASGRFASTVLVYNKVLGSESCCKDINIPSFKSPVADEERMRPGHWLGVGALNFIQCVDTVGWVTARASTHIHTHNPFSRTTQVSWCQKKASSALLWCKGR